MVLGYRNCAILSSLFLFLAQPLTRMYGLMKCLPCCNIHLAMQSYRIILCLCLSFTCIRSAARPAVCKSPTPTSCFAPCLSLSQGLRYLPDAASPSSTGSHFSCLPLPAYCYKMLWEHRSASLFPRFTFTLWHIEWKMCSRSIKCSFIAWLLLDCSSWFAWRVILPG